MRINSTNSKTNFGWDKKFHKKITKKAVESFNDIIKDEIIMHKLKKGSVYPDNHELGYLLNNHFYYPNTRASYKDPTKTSNAKSYAKFHFKKAVNQFNEGKESKAFNTLGKAFHYVQDVCVPFHSIEDNLSHIIKVVKRHTGFEEKVGQKKLLNKIQRKEQSLTSVDDIIEDNAIFSSQFKQVYKKLTDKETEEIGVACIEKAVNSTTNLMNLFLKETKNHTQKKKQLV